ncbi:MAG: tRNA 2-thiouridine(34) synthase MnmA [Tepidisphaeraceae bacterium]
MTRPADVGRHFGWINRLSEAQTHRRKVVVAMSGGVDSSVAASLLKEQGYDVIGVFLRLGMPDGVGHGDEEACKIDPSAPPKKHKQGCCSVLDAADARRMAQSLDVPFYVLNFQDDFGKIVDYFVGEYNRGRTPNPCVRCNDWIKFGRLVKYAKAVGADHVATGHYARTGVDPVTGEPCLLRGLDHSKDQSYVLFGMKPETLAMTLLPIGAMEKPVVRGIAEQRGLITFNKPDSQEICFVPDQDYAGLVQRKSPDRVKPGEVVDPSGKVLATHEGHQRFTIGQRKGVRLALGKPVYVVDIDAERNRVVVGNREQLLKRSLVATQINLPISRAAEATREPIRVQAKIRYNADPQPATMLRTGLDEIRVTFDEPQSAITPGQAVVCYDGDVVLGGGWIERAEA